MGANAPQEYKKVTREELDELAGEALPERAAMSLINANLFAPVNAAVAANVLSDNSIAYANAEQNVDVVQEISPRRCRGHGGGRCRPRAVLIGGTGVAVTERAAATSSEQGLRAYPRLADGVELLGEYEGSGYKEPHYLARRADGQLIQLSYLLYLVASAADGERDFEAIADRVTHASQRGLTGDDVRYLVEEKLRSLGVLAAADGSDAAVAKVDPLLALKFRAKVIPERVVHRLAGVFRPLFWPPVVLAVLVAFAALDLWLFFVHGVAQSLRDTLYDPVLFLVVLGMVVLSAGFHEFGHAAACAYGGARPGVMGAGIYLAWPAFYTDVSDSYRLSRAGRLRTDLGGVYFNAVFSLATAGLYFATGFEPLLLVIAVQQIEIVHQLMPFVRLDGYYIVADLTGVPDLFMRTKAILRGLLPWVPTDKRVTDLKPWVRAVVTMWVLVVLPLLLFQVLVIGLHMPRIVATGWDSLGDQWTTASTSIGAGEPFTAVVAIVQMVVLTIPLLGIALMFFMLARRTVDTRCGGGRRKARLDAPWSWWRRVSSSGCSRTPGGPTATTNRSGPARRGRCSSSCGRPPTSRADAPRSRTPTRPSSRPRRRSRRRSPYPVGSRCRYHRRKRTRRPRRRPCRLRPPSRMRRPRLAATRAWRKPRCLPTPTRRRRRRRRPNPCRRRDHDRGGNARATRVEGARRRPGRRGARVRRAGDPRCRAGTR